MSLKGTAFVAIWQDLVPQAKQDFYEWHNRQHVPERLSIPGFLRARRFIARQGTPEFFTLYELNRVETAAGKDYLDRLNNPTEWTRRVMPHFRNMARSANQLIYSGGTGEGGYLATLRFTYPGEEAFAQLGSEILPAVTELPGIVGAHLGLANDTASAIATFEKTFRTSDDVTPPCVVMIEGSSVDHVHAAIDQLTNHLSDADIAIYQVEHSASNGDHPVGDRKSTLEHARA